MLVAVEEREISLGYTIARAVSGSSEGSDVILPFACSEGFGYQFHSKKRMCAIQNRFLPSKRLESIRKL